MPKSSQATKTNDSKELKQCDCCNQQFHRRGFAAHHTACLRKAEQEKREAEFEARMENLAAQKRLREGEYFVGHLFNLSFTLFDQETPLKPRIAKPWENPGLHEKRIKPSVLPGTLFLTYFNYCKR